MFLRSLLVQQGHLHAVRVPPILILVDPASIVLYMYQDVPGTGPDFLYGFSINMAIAYAADFLKLLRRDTYDGSIVQECLKC